MGQLCKALPTGLNDGFLCARGIQSEEDPGIFSGSCKGDSGGPLIGDGVEDKRTLIGIVSGNIFSNPLSLFREKRLLICLSYGLGLSFLNKK